MTDATIVLAVTAAKQRRFVRLRIMPDIESGSRTAMLARNCRQWNTAGVTDNG
jgi:hypothetical protein